MTAQKLLTVSEIAVRLRVSNRSVMRYIKSKRLRAVKIGQWRVKEVDLDRFLAANSNK